MNRKDFLKKSALLGLATPFLGHLLSSCAREEDLIPDVQVNFDGNVLVIGAGAAGMAAGYMLNRFGIDFQILEASSNHGGRVKKIDDFADFPIDLGAEWIHTPPEILAQLIDDPTVNASIDIVQYEPDSIEYWDGSNITRLNIGSSLYGEWKFKRTTWFDFFNDYFIPSIQDRISYNEVVSRIDYSGARVLVTTEGGQSYEADRVIFAAPISVLIDERVEFEPALPQSKQDILQRVSMPPGFKASIEFSERFYPDLMSTSLEGVIGENNPELFIDGAFRKGSERHIMNLFTVQDPAGIYSSFATEAEKAEYLINRLDSIFNGQASQYYVKHVLQDWTNEPHIRGSYSFYDNYDDLPNLAAPIDNKIYFAGEAMSIDNPSTVHGAAQSAYVAVQSILETAS